MVLNMQTKLQNYSKQLMMAYNAQSYHILLTNLQTTQVVKMDKFLMMLESFLVMFTMMAKAVLNFLKMSRLPQRMPKVTQQVQLLVNLYQFQARGNLHKIILVKTHQFWTRNHSVNSVCPNTNSSNTSRESTMVRNT